ncbi:Protein FAM78B [Fukomys damarensis]|uniref:Protein FAM78B n=1 Tax=Fukomys damarensis TaxID=885580 RepID=A0A091DF28_FUKDA|nr:Protein FAM78B [Fukomys damarensis]
MGCIQSITCKARIRRENIVVYDVCATIDQCPTRIEETSPIVLRYKTPYFKASARVVMPPIPRHETWVVGWIQACNQMEFFNTYSDLGMPSDHRVNCMDPVPSLCSGMHQLELFTMCETGRPKQSEWLLSSVFPVPRNRCLP